MSATIKSATGPAPSRESYEKMSTSLRIACRPSEKGKWVAKWGYLELSRKVRELLNAACSG